MRNRELEIAFSTKNPFSFRCVTKLPFFFPSGSQEKMLSFLMGRFEQCGRIGQILGPHGTGKSTLLEVLSQHFIESGTTIFKTVLRDRQRWLPPNFADHFMGYRAENCVVIIDGYEQLTAFSRAWLCWKHRRFGFGLLITSHRPVFGWPVLYETVPNRETYQRIVQTLLKNEAEIDSQTLDSLFTKHQGNIRLILLELYDQWENLSYSNCLVEQNLKK